MQELKKKCKNRQEMRKKKVDESMRNWLVKKELAKDKTQADADE